MGLFNISFNVHLFGASNKSPGSPSHGIRPTGSAEAKALNQAFDREFTGLRKRPTSKVLSSKPMSAIARHQATGLFQLTSFKKLSQPSLRPVASPRVDAPTVSNTAAATSMPLPASNPSTPAPAELPIEQEIVRLHNAWALSQGSGNRSDTTTRGEIQRSVNKAFAALPKPEANLGSSGLNERGNDTAASRRQLVALTLQMELGVNLNAPEALSEASQAVIELGDHLSKLGSVAWPMHALVRTLCNQHAFRERAGSPDADMAALACREMAAFVGVLRSATTYPKTGAELDPLLTSHGELQPLLVAAKAGALERFLLEAERIQCRTCDIEPARVDEIRKMAQSSAARDLDRQQGLAKLRQVLIDAGRPDLLQSFGKGFRIDASAVAGLRTALGGRAQSVGLVVASLLLVERLRDSSPEVQAERVALAAAKESASRELEVVKNHLGTLLASDSPEVASLRAALERLAVAQGEGPSDHYVQRLQQTPRDLYWQLRGLVSASASQGDTQGAGLHGTAQDALRQLEGLLQPVMQAQQRLAELQARTDAIAPEIDALRRQRAALSSLAPSRSDSRLDSQAARDALDRRIAALESFHRITALNHDVQAAWDKLARARTDPTPAAIQGQDRVEHDAVIESLALQVSTLEATLRRTVAALGDDATNVAMTGGLSADEFKALGMTASESVAALEVARQLVTQGVASASKARHLTATIDFVVDRLGANRFKMIGLHNLVERSVDSARSASAQAVAMAQGLIARVTGDSEPQGMDRQAVAERMRAAVHDKILQSAAIVQANQDGPDAMWDALADRHGQQQVRLAGVVSDLDQLAEQRLAAQDVLRVFNATVAPHGAPKDLEHPSGLKLARTLVAMHELLVPFKDRPGGLTTHGSPADKQRFMTLARELRGFDPRALTVPAIQAGRKVPDESRVRQWLGQAEAAAPLRSNGHSDLDASAGARVMNVAKAIITLREAVPSQREVLDAKALEVVTDMDLAVRERAQILGSEVSEALRDTFRAAVLSVFSEVRDQAIKEKRQFELADFEPAAHAGRIRALLDEWGVPSRRLEPEINQILCESFGPDELLLWSATSRLDEAGRSAESAEQAEAKLEELSQRDERRGAGLKQVVLHGGGRLSTSAKMAMIQAIDLLEPGQKMRWSVGDAVTLRSGSIPIEPSATAKVDVSTSVTHGTNMEVELGGDGYQILFRNGLDVGVGASVSAGWTVGEFGSSKAKAGAKAGVNASGGGSWGTLLTFPRGEAGKAQCQQVLESILIRRSLRPVDLVGATRILEVEEFRAGVQGSIAATAGVESKMGDDSKVKLGLDAGVSAGAKMLYRDHHASDYRVIKKEQDVSLGIGASIGLSLATEMGAIAYTEKDTGKPDQYSAGPGIGAKAGLALGAKFEQKVVFGSDGRVVGAEQDRQLSFLPGPRVRDLALRTLGGEAFRNRLDKPGNEGLVRQCRQLTEAMGMNDVVKIRFGLSPDVQDEIDRLRLQAMALRHGHSGADRKAAIEQARQLDEQALKLLDNHESYVPKKVICMTTQEGSRSGNLLPLHWVNWSASASTFGRWVTAEINL